MYIIGALLCIASAVVSTAALLQSGVIFPLYIYPGDGCAGWTTVIGDVSSFSLIQFYFIVNPSNGPGGRPGSQPDANYQACIASLKSAGTAAGNVKVLGYVSTKRGARARSKVLKDIETYHQWSSAWRPDGIFFDEAATGAAKLHIYRTYVSRVHHVFGTSFVVLNPGTTPDASYFSIADLIVTFEDFYNNFSASKLTISAATPAHKQAVILHDGPTPVPFTIVDEISAIIGVGASFITEFSTYSSVPQDYSGFLGNIIGSQTA